MHKITVHSLLVLTIAFPFFSQGAVASGISGEADQESPEVVYHQREQKMAQGQAARAAVAEAAFPAKANAHFKQCISKHFGRVQGDYTVNGFGQGYNAPGIISSGAFRAKGDLACHAEWNTAETAIFIDCIDSNGREVRTGCPGMLP